MFSPKLLDHFENPRNAGSLEPPAVTVRVENPICGDILEVSSRVEEGRIVEARYRTRGCTASIAIGSALTELLTGCDASEVAALRAADIEAAVDGLPNESKHAAVLAADAAKALARAMRPT
ncbi:MAG: iron-sulfur cluster assembly scaffold protein [Acidobacteria bacterium]|nr:iron-sulfur cluster assembly scaffold protein [Acidobacteriota bacterium]